MERKSRTPTKKRKSSEPIPTPASRELLHTVALGEALGLTAREVRRRLASNGAALPTLGAIYSSKHKHRRLYRRMVRHCRKVVRLDGREHLSAVDGTSVLSRLLKVALRIVREPIPAYAALEREGLKESYIYTGGRHRVWVEACDQVGLGWSGNPEQAPRVYAVRARMKMAVDIVIGRGLPAAYASRRLGLSDGDIAHLRARYPAYWNFLREQIRTELGLCEGQRVVSQIIDADDWVVVGLPKGMSAKARAQRRKARGLGRDAPLSERAKLFAKQAREIAPGSPASTRPKDLIVINVALSEYEVSRRSLDRYIRAGKLTDHRLEGASKVAQRQLSRAELAQHFTRKS